MTVEDRGLVIFHIYCLCSNDDRCCVGEAFDWLHTCDCVAAVGVGPTGKVCVLYHAWSGKCASAILALEGVMEWLLGAQLTVSLICSV